MFPDFLCVLQIYYLTSPSRNTFNSGWDLAIKCNHITFIKLYCWLWVIGCNWLSYNTNLKPLTYLYFEKLFKRNPRAVRSFFLFFFEIGSEEGTQYGDIANSVTCCQSVFIMQWYSWLPTTRTLTNSNFVLTWTKIDFPWISDIDVIHLL